MKRILAALAAVVVVASLATGVTIWRLTRDATPHLPEISAYSHGQLTRVGPYRYCEVLNLNNCLITEAQGELAVDDTGPVQLSVPAAIASVPWRLLRVYDDPVDTTASVFRPDSRLAVTVPTLDPQRGRLTGVVVQLMTLVLDPAGELADVPHAEWSVRTVWS